MAERWLSRGALLASASIICLLCVQTPLIHAAEDPDLTKSQQKAHPRRTRATPAEDQAPSSQTHGPQEGLETITVQARKKREDLTKVPVAVSVLTQKQMRLRSIRGIQGISDFTPGFHSDNQTVGRNDRGFNSYTIRGIVSGSTSTRPGVTVFLDGTPIAGGNISGIQGIDHVEVIKGPQSAYFGRSTFAGAINLITTPPSNQWHGNIDTEYGNYDTTDDRASVEGPILPDLLDFRASYRHYSTSGQYNDELEPGIKLGKRSTNSGILEFRATPTEDLTLNYFLNIWTDDDGPSAQGQLSSGFTNCNLPGGNGLGYTCGQIKGTPTNSFLYDVLPSNRNLIDYVDSPDSTLQNAISPAIINGLGLSRRAYQNHLNFTDRLGQGYTLSGNIARDENNWIEDQGPIGANNLIVANPLLGVIPGGPRYETFAIRVDAPDADLSTEIRLTSPQNNRFKWTFGFNYYQQRSALSTVADGYFGAQQFSPYTKTDIDTLGVFGSANYDILRNLTITAEGREQWDDVRQDVVLAGGPGPGFKSTFSSFSPRFILSYHPIDAVTLYTSYARGFRPGEFNPQFAGATAAQRTQVLQQVPAVSTVVPQEKVDMVEAGVKTLLLHNRLRLIADAYYGDWSNYHITDQAQTVTDGAISTVQVVLPGGRILLHGVEAEAAYQVDRHLIVEATFDWAATNIRNDYCIACLAINGVANNRGNALPGYPVFTGTISATYNHELGRHYTGFVHADYIYRGRQYADDTNISYIGNSNRLNMQVGVQRGRYEIALVGTNLTNDKTPTSIADVGDMFIPGKYDVLLSPAEKPYYGFRAHVGF